MDRSHPDYKKIMDAYVPGESATALAKKTHVSAVTVQRVLITEGILEGKYTRQVVELYNEGNTPADIAEFLGVSVATVYANMPYPKRRGDISDSPWGQETKDVAGEESATKQRARVAGTFTKEQAGKLYLNLHLAINLYGISKEDFEVFEKYAQVKDGFLRDLIVPANMRLSEFAPIIQKLYGWGGHMDMYQDQKGKDVQMSKTLLSFFLRGNKIQNEYLIYTYDFGDSWEILISVSDIYELKQVEENGSTTVKPFDMFSGKEAPSDLLTAIQESAKRKRPYLYAADGIYLLDDMGGIFGVSEFLESVYGDNEDEREEMLDWASDYGWKPEKPKVGKLY